MSVARHFVLIASLLVGCGRLGFDPVGDDSPEGGDVGPDAGTGLVVGDGPGLGNCGASQAHACNARSALPGGSFARGNDPFYPASLTSFELDTYEVTVARFREFVDAGFGIRLAPPAAGGGAHPSIPGSGWNPVWNLELELTTQALRARLVDHPLATFTAEPGADDVLPINHVRWFEAFAFCIWDGGRLPTHAEYQFAAVGGGEQRVFPWSSPPTASTITAAHVNLSDALEPVGSHPAGAGRWGHADLVGNVDEWSLDYFGELPTPCTNCANLTPSVTRLLNGYWYGLETSWYEATSLLHGAGPSVVSGAMGFRCAR